MSAMPSCSRPAPAVAEGQRAEDRGMVESRRGLWQELAVGVGQLEQYVVLTGRRGLDPYLTEPGHEPRELGGGGGAAVDHQVTIGA
jgi:hypothetical protein